MTVIWGKNIKELTGTVLSNTMLKSLIVSVSRVAMHPLYKKRFVVKKKYYVHDEHNAFNIGDSVTIRQCRPISKLKRRIVIA